MTSTIARIESGFRVTRFAFLRSIFVLFVVGCVVDKSEGIYDRWAHENPDEIVDRSDVDVAADGYHKFKEDVQLLKNAGMKHYRFSLSWSRILPNGWANKISADGIRYYNDLIDELIANDIEPMITLHHMDHPQTVEDMGGWTNSVIVDMFADYARVVFDAFADRVPTFVTLNQPFIMCEVGYHDLPPYTIAPGKKLGDYGKYMCMHNALKAHARAWRMYDEEYRPKYNGNISIIGACYSFQPLNASNENDVVAADVGFQFNCGWMAHPVHVGDYPTVMKEKIAEFSKIQGYPKSILPEFTEEEIEYIKGTYDFFGVNYYYAWTARFQTEEEYATSPADSSIVIAQIVDHQVAIEGLATLMEKVRVEYDNPKFLVMESGLSTDVNEDYERIAYYHGMLTTMLETMKKGSNGIGFYVWGLLDCWEFMFGYTRRYGIYEVDYTSANRTRRPRLSVDWWRAVSETRQVQPIVSSSYC